MLVAMRGIFFSVYIHSLFDAVHTKLEQDGMGGGVGT